MLVLKDCRDERDTTGRVIHDDTEGCLVVDHCGILVIRSVAVVELAGERIRERTPLITTKLRLAGQSTLLDVRLLLVAGIENVETIGLSGTSIRVHDLVGHEVILGGVNEKLNLKAIGGNPTSDLNIRNSNGVTIGEILLGTLGEIGRILHAVQRHPSGHLLLRLTREQDSSTLTSANNELALLVVKLTGADLIEKVLKETHGELGVVLLVAESKELTEACALTVSQTRETEVGGLTVLHLGGDATLESIVLVLSPGLLNLPSHIVHPAVNSGILHLAVDFLCDGDTTCKPLAELLATDLVLETDAAPILAHGYGAGETDITNLTGEVVLDRSITVAQTLTREEAVNGNTVGDIGTEELDLIDGVDTLGTTRLHNDHRISLIEITPDDFTKCEPVNVGNEIERLVADTNIISAGIRVDHGSIATTSLHERDVTTGRSDDVPMQLGIIFIGTGGNLPGEVGVHRGKIHGAHEDSHDVTGHLRLRTEDVIKVIVLCNSSTPSGNANVLCVCNTSWHKAIKF